MPILLGMIAAGCQVEDPFWREDAKDPGMSEPIGTSQKGAPIEAWVFPGRRPSVMIVGGIHGNEPSSSTLVEALKERLMEDPEARERRMVVLVPRANPDGLDANTRHNAAGIDVNRNFPTRNFRPGGSGGARRMSESETLALVRAMIRYDPARVISVHAPLRCIDPDGGSATMALARDLSVIGGLPVKDLPAHHGSMGTYVGIDLGLEMITYELAWRRAPSKEALEPHLKALLLAIRGMWDRPET
jgi:protein MpaA